MDTGYGKQLSNLKTYTDTTNPNLIYIGVAIRTTASDKKGWDIKVIETAGTIIKEKFATVDGVIKEDMVFIWDDRASYTYL